MSLHNDKRLKANIRNKKIFMIRIERTFNFGYIFMWDVLIHYFYCYL